MHTVGATPWSLVAATGRVAEVIAGWQCVTVTAIFAPPAGFPYVALFVVIPCALLTIMGVRTRLSASVLLLDMLRHSASIIFGGL